MAAVHGLDFGSDIVVTYGPLGFLKSYLVFFPGTARLAVAYGVVLHLALCISLVWALRRNFGALIAVVIALAIAALARGDLSAVAVRDDAAVVVLAFIWCVAALSDDSPAWTRSWSSMAAARSQRSRSSRSSIRGRWCSRCRDHRRGDRGQRWRNLAILASSFLGSVACRGRVRAGTRRHRRLYRQPRSRLRAPSGARFDYGFDQRDYDYVLTPLVIGAAGAIA